jgi:hypothetical protein
MATTTPNSTATMTVTVQAQNLEPPTAQPTVNQTPPSVIFQANTNLQYGTLTISNTALINFFANLDPGCPFLYMRNANSGGNNMLIAFLQQPGGAQFSLNIGPGGFLSYGNLVNGPLGTDPVAVLAQAGYAVFFNSPVIMEYMWAS